MNCFCVLKNMNDRLARFISQNYAFILNKIKYINVIIVLNYISIIRLLYKKVD